MWLTLYFPVKYLLVLASLFVFCHVLKKVQAIFLKRIFTQNHNKLWQKWYFTISTITKSKICFDTRAGSEGGESQPFSFTMRYYTFVSCWLPFFLFFVSVSVTFFYSTLFCEPSISAGNQCAKLTAAAFNSVYFSVRTRFDRGKTTHKFISCKYVQKETDLIYFVSLLEVYEEMFRNVLLSNIC